MIAAVAVLTAIAATLAAVLVVADKRFRPDVDTLATTIESRLPRIQCGQCGYPGCRPYAEAIAAGNAAINQCPPGGQTLVDELAALLGSDEQALDVSFGQASMDRVARIDESACIGCNLCVPACPVDAIVGVQQYMHTVLDAHCTGCELCLTPCPVDCIDLVPRDG